MSLMTEFTNWAKAKPGYATILGVVAICGLVVITNKVIDKATDLAHDAIDHSYGVTIRPNDIEIGPQRQLLDAPY